MRAGPNVKASLGLFLLVAVARCTSCYGFCPRPDSRTLVPHRGVRNAYSPRASRRYLSSDNDEENKKPENKDDERDSYTWEELQADEELRKLEFDSSMNRKNMMFLPQRISAAVTTLGWLFVVAGIILNQVGYAWVKSPSGGLGVGTLDERDFQREVMRERRRAIEEEKPATTISKIGSTSNDGILGWVEQEKHSRSV